MSYKIVPYVDYSGNYQVLTYNGKAVCSYNTYTGDYYHKGSIPEDVFKDFQKKCNQFKTPAHNIKIANLITQALFGNKKAQDTIQDALFEVYGSYDVVSLEELDMSNDRLIKSLHIGLSKLENY